MALDDILKLITGAGNDTIQPGPKNSILDSIRNQHITTPVSQFVQVEQQNRPNMSSLDDPNVQKFLYALHKVEGGGDQFDVGVVHIPFNRGKLVTTSTARGAFQFIARTRNSILRRYGVDAWSTDPREQQMAALYVLYDKDPEIINRIKSGDLKGAGELVNAGLAEGSELFEGVKNQKETFEAAIDEGNLIKDVEVVNNFEENLIAKRKKLNEYANDGSYVYINLRGERKPFKQSTADTFTINAYDDVPESVNFTTTAPDLTVRNLDDYVNYYGEGTTIINANGKDYILVPTDSGEPQQIPIQVANTQLDAGEAVVQGNEQEVTTATEESEGEYKITPLQEGDEVLELQPNFIDDLRSPEAGRADGTPLSDAEIYAEIQKMAGDDIDVVEDENGRLVVIKKRPKSKDVQVVSGQDNPVPQPNVLDEKGDEVVSPVVPDVDTEETEEDTQETTEQWESSLTEDERKIISSYSIDGSVGEGKAAIKNSEGKIVAHIEGNELVGYRNVPLLGEQRFVIGSYKDNGDGTYTFEEGKDYNLVMNNVDEEDKAVIDTFRKAAEDNPEFAQTIVNASDGTEVLSGDDLLNSATTRSDSTAVEDTEQTQEEEVIDPNDGQEINTGDTQENNITTPQPTLEEVQRRHGPDATIGNVNGVDVVLATDMNGEPLQYDLDKFYSEENLETYRLQDSGEMPPPQRVPTGDIPTRQDNTATITTPPVEPQIVEGEEVPPIDPSFIPNEESTTADTRIDQTTPDETEVPENVSNVEDVPDGTGPGGPDGTSPDGTAPDGTAPGVEDDQGGGGGNKREPFKPNVPGVLSSIGGISSLVSALFAKRGLDEALKEVDVPNTPGLSQAFKRHFYESEQLAKSGMSLNEQDQVQKNIDQAYTQGIDKIVRGTSGDRAKFLAGLGVLDAQRNSSLLKAAALNDQIKRQNRQEYTKLLDFKETFEANKSEKERNEELKAALTKQSMYADLSGKAIKNIFDNMTAAKMYGKGSNYDNMMRMQMYNMGFDPPANAGLPSMIQNIVNSFSNKNNNDNNTQQ
jgi:hypothetical protein